jgi:phage/plasmid-like protein (TIGR03299 family)
MNVNAEFDATRAGQISEVAAYNAAATDWNAGNADRIAAAQAEATARFEARVANGTMVNLGGGRYQVNDPDSWDNNEVFTVQRQAGDLRQLMVMPEHGLEVVDGKAALYTRYPEWHDLGTVIPAGLSSIPLVMRAGGMDFRVLQRPSGAMLPGPDGEDVFVTDPGKFVNYRSDSGALLATVGKIYTPIQPSESMAFLQSLVDDGSVIIESAGVMDGGVKIFITCLLPEHMVIDADGIADEVQMHIAVLDRFDGNGKFRAIATPWRIRCGNTERFALADAVASWGIRHTTNALARVQEAQRTLGLANKYAAAFVAEETLLARTAITNADFDALIAEVWGERDKAGESKRSTTVADRREGELHSLFGQYSAELGRTAYGAERSITDYMDHVAPRRVLGDKLAAARATAALEGTDDITKAKAHSALMALTNR